MHTIVKHTRIAVIALGLAGLAPSFTPAAHAEAPAAETAAVKPDLKKVNQHLKEHQTYPATRSELLASCNGLVDFSPGEKRWYADHLPAGTYKSAAEVMKAINRK